jgi:hypothetical protein
VGECSLSCCLWESVPYPAACGRVFLILLSWERVFLVLLPVGECSLSCCLWESVPYPVACGRVFLILLPWERVLLTLQPEEGIPYPPVYGVSVLDTNA